MIEALLFLRPEDGERYWTYEGQIRTGFTSNLPEYSNPSSGYVGAGGSGVRGTSTPHFDGAVVWWGFNPERCHAVTEAGGTVPLGSRIEINGVEYEIAENGDVVNAPASPGPSQNVTIKFGGTPGDPGDPGDPDPGDPDPGDPVWAYEGTVTIGDGSSMGLPGRGFSATGGTAIFGSANPLFNGSLVSVGFVMATDGLMSGNPLGEVVSIDGVEYDVDETGEVDMDPAQFPAIGATVPFKYGNYDGGGGDPGDPDPGDPNDPGPPPGPWVYEGTMTPAGGGIGPGVTYIDTGGSLTTRGTITPLPVPAYIRFIAQSSVILGEEVWNATFDLQDGTPSTPPGTIVEIGGVRRSVSSNGNVDDIPPIEPGVPISIKWWY